MFRYIQLSVVAVAMLVAAAGQAEADHLGSANPVYISSLGNGEPWGEDVNITLMDEIFGTGGWDHLYFEWFPEGGAGPVPHEIPFIFIEGSDMGANQLEGFLGDNITALEDWVIDGGNLFINAAPNEGDGMSFGFGGVNLEYDGTTSSEEVVSVAPMHPIFNGPFPTIGEGDILEGDSFGHGLIADGGEQGTIIESLIADISGTGPDDRVVLAEFHAPELDGIGRVIFGGMTMPTFHDPEDAAWGLRANIIAYTAGVEPVGPVVPEPSSLALFGIGALGLGFYARRRKQESATA